MKTKRFVYHLRAAEDALWRENRKIFEGIAAEVAARYRLSADDVELVTVAIRERLWEKLVNIAKARQPERVARTAAYQAATEAAIALLPDERRIQLVEQKRAKRRKRAS